MGLLLPRTHLHGVNNSLESAFYTDQFCFLAAEEHWVGWIFGSRMQRNLSQYNSKRGKSIFPSVSSGLAIKLGGITRIISFLTVYWSVISDSVKARWWFKLARLYRAKITWHDQYLRKWKTTEICQPLCQNRHLCHRPFLLGQAESAFSLTESDFFRLLFSLFSTDQSSGVTLLRLHVKPNPTFPTCRPVLTLAFQVSSRLWSRVSLANYFTEIYHKKWKGKGPNWQISNKRTVLISRGS